MKRAVIFTGGFCDTEALGTDQQLTEILAEAYVIAADINSGMNGDTGEAELAVRSDLTVSIGFYKKGLFTGRAPELIGRLVNVDFGIVLEELSGETE